MPSRAAYLLKTVTFAVIYVTTARLGLLFDAVSGFATLIWPPTGISIAALILYGPGLWPGVFVGALVVNVLIGAPILVATGIAIGNTLEALVVAYALSRIDFHRALDRLRDVLALTALSFAGATLSATSGVASLWAGTEVGATGRTWLAWWLGDLTGALLLAPMFLTWSDKYTPGVIGERPRVLEILTLTLSLILVSGIIFYDWVNLWFLHRVYFLFPPLLWTALRLGARGAASMNLLVNVIAVSATVLGIGPFGRGPRLEGLIDLQLFMAFSSVATLMMSAVVSERSQTLALAEESQTRENAILEAAMDAIVTTDHEGRIRELNASTERLFGATKGDLLGRDLASLLAPETVRESYRSALTHDRSIAEAPLLGRRLYGIGVRADGTELPIELSIAPVITRGRPPLFTSYIRDITAQREAEQILQQSQEKLERQVEERTAALRVLNLSLERREEQLEEAQALAHLGSWEWDVEKNRVTCSDEMYRIYGLAPGSAVTYETFFELIHPEDRDRAGTIIEQALRAQQPFSFEERIVRENGAIRDIQIQGKVYSNEEGRAVRLVGYSQDITEKKSAEAELRASLREKEVLVKEIHHRVKNNLQVVASLLNLQASAMSNEEAKRGLQESQHRVQSMALVHQLLYRSNLERIEFSDYLETLIGSLVQSYGLEAEGIDISGSAPNLAIDVDTAISCGLIVNELVSNSFKHAFPERRRGKIEISLLRDAEGRYVLTVADDGVGISDDIRLDSLHTLGLQIVLALTKQLHGTAEMSRDHGTRFCVTFAPASRPSDAAHDRDGVVPQ